MITDRTLAVLTSGGDAPGMNAAVSVAARCLLNLGFPVYGAANDFAGLIQDQYRELDWHELVAWVYRRSSEIGTARVHVDLDPEKIAQIAQNFKKMIICLSNEHCSRRYTTDFMHRVFEEESNGESYNTI